MNTIELKVSNYLFHVNDARRHTRLGQKHSAKIAALIAQDVLNLIPGGMLTVNTINS